MSAHDATLHSGKGSHLFDTLDIRHHDAHGYYAEVPAETAVELSERLGRAGVFCQPAPTDAFPCAGEHAESGGLSHGIKGVRTFLSTILHKKSPATGRAAMVFGHVNPHALRNAMQKETAADVTLDATRWPHGETAYSPVVDAVLRLGEKEARDKQFDYLALGLTEAHIPELVMAARDPAFNDYTEGDAYEWAGVHPMLALNAFPRVPFGAARPLMELLRVQDDDFSDWVTEKIPEILGKIGIEIIPLLKALIAGESSNDTFCVCSDAFKAIKQIAVSDPESRARCVQELVLGLQNHARQVPELNAFIVGYLLDLEAVEAVDTLEAAFKAGHVDISVCGDLEDALISLGLLDARTTPVPDYRALLLKRMRGKASGDDFDDDFDDDPDEDFYGDPLTPYRREEPKIGRNDPCPCGSGKKHKKCCGKNS